MTILKINTFAGEIPRLPDDRLPAGYAKKAVNCNFAHNELRPLLGLGTHYPVHSSAKPCRTVWTPDGNLFFAWNKEVRAFKSPVIDDMHGRIYFNVAGEGVRVATTEGLRGLGDQPRPPSNQWKAGVKAPTGINVEVNPNAVVQITAQLVVDGAIVKEGVVPDADVIVIEDGRTFQIALPALWDVTTEQDPQTPGGDGYITGTRAITYTAISGENEVSGAALAGGWAVNGAGQLRILSTVYNSVINIVHEGRTYTRAGDLFAGLLSGDALVKAGTVFVQFRVKLSNATTGAVIYDEVRPHTVHPDFDTIYRITNNTGKVSVAYVAVAINQWGEESAPTSPFLIDMNDDGQNAPRITVQLTPDAAEAPITGVVIYRTYPGSTSTDYFLLAGVHTADPDGFYRYTDATTTPHYVTTLNPSQAAWDTPPAQAKNMVYFGNGSFVVSQGKDLVFSEPYRPHAWPYRMTLPYTIIAMAAIEGGILVVTDTHSFTVSGAHPTQASQRMLPVDQAGWTSRAIARVDGTAVYASHDGLVDIFGGLPSLSASQQLFTRRDWRELYWWPAQYALTLGQHDGNLLGIVVEEDLRPTTTASSFLLRLDEAEGSLSMLNLDFPTVGGAVVKPMGLSVCASTDQLFLTTNDGVAEFAVGAPLQCEWHSGDVRYPAPVNFGAVIVDCVGVAQVQVYADDVLRVTQACDGHTSFRLPSGSPALRWSVKVTGTAIVRRIVLASSFAEIKRG